MRRPLHPMLLLRLQLPLMRLRLLAMANQAAALLNLKLLKNRRCKSSIQAGRSKLAKGVSPRREKRPFPFLLP